MTDEMESARLRDSLAKRADKFGAATGDERFRRAAGVLRGKPSGRRAVDDTEALACAKSLFAAGCSKNSACVQAANLYAPTDIAIDATIARLLRKFIQN